MAYERLGDLLMNIGLISHEELDRALSLQKGSKKRLGDILTENGFITEQQLIEALELQLGIEFIDLSKAVPPPEMAQVLSKNIARKYDVVPVRVDRDSIYLAMSDPLNFVAVEEVKTATRKRVVPMIATGEAVSRAIMTLYGNEGAARAIEDMKREARDSDAAPVSSVSILDSDVQSAPTVRLVNSIIERAVVERASDIHLEPQEGEVRVRMRIDGLLRNILTVPKNLQSSVVSRLKVMGGMDIAERKVPQDGRANITVRHGEVDLRMSTLPTIYGEKFVIRLLDKNVQLLDTVALGLAGLDLAKYNELMTAQSGVLLIVGPTGSGKSSTMYTMLRQLNTEQVNLVTLEDPVEYHLDGISQVQINEKTGMTFSEGLRSILRQDPDIIAVGEIRDGETASIAMRAAITGHLVLSTVHTSNAAAAIDRLLDIGVEPYLIAGALRGVISQRLVRRVCPQCRREYTPPEADLESLGLDGSHTFYHGVGCPMCFHTGYRGRTGVFEILPIRRELRRGIADGLDRERLRALIGQSDFVSLADNCRRLVLEGVTTVGEALRVINSADL